MQYTKWPFICQNDEKHFEMCLFNESGVFNFAQKMWLVWRVYFVQKLSYLDTKDM